MVYSWNDVSGDISKVPLFQKARMVGLGKARRRYGYTIIIQVN